jgi:hypothetical protein
VNILVPVCDAIVFLLAVRIDVNFRPGIVLVIKDTASVPTADGLPVIVFQNPVGYQYVVQRFIKV